ncbi:MAG: hypothetical protein IJW73_05240, partial [Candidatus Gastranaerophilales bacterium]|nr:hypothetical protein [Candidatus Gastranaerophilales bacterium]
AKMVARQQFAQYGMTKVPDDTLEEYAKRILADKNYRPRLIEEVVEATLLKPSSPKSIERVLVTMASSSTINILPNLSILKR